MAKVTFPPISHLSQCSRCASNRQDESVRERTACEIGGNVTFAIYASNPVGSGGKPEELARLIEADHGGSRRIEDASTHTTHELVPDLVRDSQARGEVKIVGVPGVPVVFVSVFKRSMHRKAEPRTDRVDCACVEVGQPVVAFCRRPRSEERRVGKECRSRWSGYQGRKKKYKGVE